MATKKGYLFAELDVVDSAHFYNEESEIDRCLAVLAGVL